MTEDILLKAAREGDKSAESQLMNKYSPLVKSICAGFFMSGGTGEDLFQEGMVGLYSAIGSFDDSCGVNFKTYAYRCVRNAVLNAVKKSVGSKNKALNNFVPIVEIAGEFSPADPEDELLLKEQRREFTLKISKLLSSFEFKVTVMYLDGLSAAEIASATSKSVKSVSNALTRAKNKILKSYNSEE